MDKVKKYKTIAAEIVEKIRTRGTNSDKPMVIHQAVKDQEGGHFLLFYNGWKEDMRFYGCYLHIDVTEDGKVWLQHDGTDLIVAKQLEEKGIPKSDIVIGFHAPFMREDTEHALG
ncbi:MAG: XisI protein [Chitinophagales bacterium]